jgi:calcium-dependent protein kinase
MFKCECVSGVLAAVTPDRRSKTKHITRSATADSWLPKREVKADGIGSAMFVITNEDRITSKYAMSSSVLGEGSQGSVTKAKNLKSGQWMAVKSIRKPKIKEKQDRLKQEIAIMKMMDHPNIIKLHETFEDNRCIYLVMELCTGGELFERILAMGNFTELQAAILMQQLIRSVFYLHNLQICHRDLKPENFILSTKGPIEHKDTLLKLIDFGFSCRSNGVLTTRAGTPYYVSPQVLTGHYDIACDMWSVGVVMYVMLCGYPPFGGETDDEVLRKVKLGTFSFVRNDWKHISPDARDLIRMLLKMNPTERCTAEQALNHTWLKDRAPKATVDMCPDFVDKLRKFSSSCKLKKAVLHIIAGHLDDKQIQSLRDTFHHLDENGDGLLSLQEIVTGLQKAEMPSSPADLHDIMEQIDSDGSGLVDYTEFLAATLNQRTYMQEDICWNAFRVFDINGDGKISREEIAKVLHEGNLEKSTLQGVGLMMKDFDTNGDGVIDFEEFMHMMRGGDR